MRPRILFVVMSAVHKAAAIDELAKSLAPHSVLVHHDFVQTPDFELHEPNVFFVADPRRTAWGKFSLVDGIFHALQHAMKHLEFDYLQLLSPTCLPIKPVAEFEDHVNRGVEAHFGCIDLLENHDALMSLGYRAFTPDNTFRHRVARYLTYRIYYAGVSGNFEEAGVSYRTGFAAGRRGRMTLAARVARLAIIALSKPFIGRHLFSSALRPYVGSVWFGARRHVIGALIAAYSRPGVRDFFSKIVIAEEFLIPTLLKTLEIRAGPMNHYISVFEEAHPRWITDPDFETLRRSPAFFARKFPDDPQSPVRKRVLKDLVHRDAKAPAGLHAVQKMANG